MNLQQPQPPALKPAEYCTTRGRDTPEERDDAGRVLRLQGCKSIRFETLNDGRLVAHGYLAAGLVFP